MHAQRWLTAVVAIPILLLALLKGGHFFFVLIIFGVNVLAQWEFLGMFSPDSDRIRRLKAIILGSVLLLSFCTSPRAVALCSPQSSGPLFVLVGVLFLLLLFYLASYGHIEDLGRDLMANVLCIVYLPLLLGHFIWLRYLPEGQWWVLWVMAVMFAGDTAAFYAGRTWGGAKLYPVVSPGKTWAGAYGGLAGAVLVGVLLGCWAIPKMTIVQLVWLSAGLALLGMLGDLFESMLKRQAQVKDASNILPGHGGMLDRLDSLLFAAPAAVYARLFIIGW
jgi:phosphatidate cytidylyltransferase